MQNGLIDAALSYALRGFYVFPCKPGEKVPLTKHGVKDATIDPKQIREWWAKWPDANIALACGPKSGIYVVDIDVDAEKGIDGWASLHALPGDLPLTVRQDTPRGGAHFLYRTDNPPKNKNSFHPGIDIRSDGYYIMLAPSIHPNGKVYAWTRDFGPDEIELSEYPDLMRPPERTTTLPWDQKPPVRAPESPASTPIIERARAYLRECTPAVQGQAGHDALLWAARAMVIGFELDNLTAIQLLWNEFNPRCSPPWNPGDPADTKDFERKVSQARTTPGEKPSGWLLDENGLRSDDDALSALGAKFRAGLLAGEEAKQVRASIASTITVAKEQISIVVYKFRPFPVNAFPPKIADFVQYASAAHCVDPAFLGLPVCVVTAAAIGNLFRLRLKQKFEVPAVLWGAIVAGSGTNKSAPLRDVVAPLRRMIRIDEIEAPVLNPQSRMVMSDATLEAVIAKLATTPHGLCLFRDELAGWTKGFDAYKKGGGGDEQAWIEFWNAHEYQLDRKTNSEESSISSAAVSVLGGIQPKVLAECFDPGKFASGLVPRLLIAHPPDTGIRWTEEELTPDRLKVWEDAITWLRTRPFAGLDPNEGKFVSHVLDLEPTAKVRYIDFYNSISVEIEGMNEQARMFASKARVMAARLALVHRGLWLVTEGGQIADRVPEASINAGVDLARWFLDEQLRVYGLAAAKREQEVLNDFTDELRGKFGGSVTPRQLNRMNSGKYPSAEEAKKALDVLAHAGHGTWDAGKRKFTLNPKGTT